MKRGWVAAVVVVLVAQMALGSLDPWEVRDGRWPPPAVTAGLLLAVLGVGWVTTRREGRPRGGGRRGRSPRRSAVPPSSAGPKGEPRDASGTPPPGADGP